MSWFQMIHSTHVSRHFLTSLWKKSVRHMTNIIPCPCEEKMSCVPDFCEVGPLNDPPRVVIIGAGLAGLTAAERLIKCGVKNVQILEGAPRPGGRIYTCDCERSPVDLGAQWIYGACNGNMMYNLACQERLIEHPVEYLCPYRGVYLTSSGIPIKTSVLRKGIQAFHKIKRKAKRLHRTIDHIDEYLTLWEFFQRCINKSLNEEFTKGERNDVERLMYSFLNTIKAKIGDSLDKIPARKYGAHHEIPGGYVGIKMGMKSLLEPMLRSIPKESIKYKKTVRVIRWKNSYEQSRVELHCCDGTQYEADYVICTVPLGVLKRHYEELFCPHLPTSKLDAIQNLGFGNIFKAFFEYEKPFWIKTEGKMRLAWFENEIKSKKWTNSIGLIEEAPSCGKSLLVTVGGDEANCMETLSTAELIDNITMLLRKFLGNYAIPYPKNMLRSNWGLNTFTAGSVTYLGKDSVLPHIRELGCPLPGYTETTAPVLLFAGEATSLDSYGTLQGARYSGLREAERILTITKRFKGRPKMDSYKICA